MLKKVKPDIDFIALEHEILSFWEKEKCFDKLRELRKNSPRWSFQDGPITANNPMGVHHAWGRTLKDVFQRYKAMTGHQLRYQNGFDCQGLWVEVEVEKQLGLKSKKDIEQLGLDKFTNACKDRVKKYSKIQTDQSIRLGYWMDWDKSYFTMSDENNYTIWMFLKKCYENGWIYKGNDVMPWCIDCGAALSEHEIATEGYKERTHTSVFISLPIKNKDNEYLLVWTTTPWTLTSNVAAAVHPELDYVAVEQDNKTMYLSKGCVNKLKKGYNIVKTLKGKELIGLEYSGPFDELAVQDGVVHRVIPWEDVAETEGTGIVHIAPGCGKEDRGLADIHKLTIIAPLDEFGTYIDGFGWLTGKNVRDISDEIVIDLKKKDILYKKEKYTHRYPVCWRHGSDLVFRLVDEWFIKMDELRYKIMDITKKIRWIPEFGMERELDWLKNMHDWMISKKRYWGLALPIFECEKCGHFTVIGGKEELKERAIEGWEEFDGNSPHRPWVDKIKIKCEKCGEKVSRIPDVGNPWLDAGIVPYSTIGYLSDNENWKKWFPPDFVTECFPGQFRNWFYSLLAMSTVMTNDVPFKVLLGHALVRDENGEEMHKSSGNAIWFDDAAEKMGVDVMRWMYCAQNPTHNLNFGYTPADIVRRRIIQYWNSYSFFVNYAILDNYNPEENKVPYNERPILDRWILSRLQFLIEQAHKAFDDYHAYLTMKNAEKFIDDLSNWYIRRSRRRFWKSEKDNEKFSAYHTLYEVLVSFTKILAPMIPFLTEEVYQNLVRSYYPDKFLSIHHEAYPTVNAELKDESIMKEIDLVIQITEIARAARKKENIRIRQPLQTMFVKVKDENEEDMVLRNCNDFNEELNIREVKIMRDTSEYLKQSLKPMFSTLGPKYGKKIGAIKKYIEEHDHSEIIKDINGNGQHSFNIDGEEIILNIEDLEIVNEEKEGFAIWEDKGYYVALDTKLTEDLIFEGNVRDLIRHVQNLRKDVGLEIEDHIKLEIDCTDENIINAINSYMDYLKQETLADKVSFISINGDSKNTTSITIENSKLNISLHKDQI